MYFNPICSAICASLAGSVASGAFGLPLATEQNLQFRVQTLPKIKTVAVPLEKHSPRFGQSAFTHIVSSDSEVNILLVRSYASPDGKGLRSQLGSPRICSALFCIALVSLSEMFRQQVG